MCVYGYEKLVFVQRTNDQGNLITNLNNKKREREIGNRTKREEKARETGKSVSEKWLFRRTAQSRQRGSARLRLLL